MNGTATEQKNERSDDRVKAVADCREEWTRAVTRRRWQRRAANVKAKGETSK